MRQEKLKRQKFIMAWLLMMLSIIMILNGTVDAKVIIDLNRADFNCNGTSTEFPYDFEILKDAEMQAIVKDSAGAETDLQLNTDYTVSGAGNPSGGTVTLTSGSVCASGETLTLLRNIQRTQETAYSPYGPFPATSVENNMDKLTLIVQDINEKVGRAATVPRSSTLSNVELPISASRVIGWDATATALTTYSTGTVTAANFDSLQNHNNSLVNAVINLGASNKTLVCDIAQTISANLTVPSNIHFMPIKGCMISIDATKTLTFEGPITADRFQWLTGAGDFKVSRTGTRLIYPEWCGAKGDAQFFDYTTANDWYTDSGFTSLANDDTAEINMCLNALKTTNGTTREHSKYRGFENAGILDLRTGAKYRISSPILAESDHSVSPPVYLDDLWIIGNGAALVSAATFTGVAREYDTIGGSDTHKAMIMLGPKEPGKVALEYQNFNRVIGLTFIGDFDQDMSGIFVDLGHEYFFHDINFYKMGYGLKWRVLRNSTINKLYAYDVHSGIYANNNTEVIMNADPLAKWGTVYQSSNNCHISDFNYQTDVSRAGLLEANASRGALHLQGVGECNINGVTIFGGTRGIVIVSNRQAYSVGPGFQWTTLMNAEVDGVEHYPIFISHQNEFSMSHIVLTDNVKDTMSGSGWTITYDKPIITLQGVWNATFNDIRIDRKDLAGTNTYGTNSILLRDLPASDDYFTYASSVSATNNLFSNIYSDGDQVITDDTYSHIKLVDASYNSFVNVHLGIETGTGFDFLYGFELDVNSDFNNFNNLIVRGLTNSGLATDGGEFSFAAGGDNKVVNVQYERASSVQMTQITGATPSVDNDTTFNVANTGATNMTSFARAHEGKVIKLYFANGNTTVVDASQPGGNDIHINGSINWTPGAEDTLTLERMSNKWVEIGRSDN